MKISRSIFKTQDSRLWYLDFLVLARFVKSSKEADVSKMEPPRIQ